MSDGQDPIARLDRANQLADQGRPDEAMVEFRALEGFGPAHANLALLLEQQRDLPGAVQQHRRACALMPGHAQVWFNAGTALEHARHYAESEAAYRRALELNPAFAEAWHNLGNCLQEQGRVTEADQAFRQALVIRPDFALAKSSHLMNLHYLPQTSPGEIFEATRRYAATFEGKARVWPLEKRPERRLKIGLLCAYVRRHPLGSLAVAGLEALDRQRFSLHAYVNESSRDEAAQRLSAACTDWREIGGISDEDAAGQIVADGIDILIDLAGHTRGHRLGVMGLKPAPVQLHWGAAYWNGLGLSAIGRLLTDRIEVPPANPPPLIETPLYLPDCFACYSPPSDAPPVAPLPMLTQGAPCLGSFNRLAKLNDEVLALWGRLMAAAPANTRLLVQAHAFDDEAVQRGFLDRLGKQGIAGPQVELIGALSPFDVLKTYARVDVALDSFPWSGSIITLEALLMGVPVVTLPYPSIAGRHAASFLTALGEPGWIAGGPDNYIAIALNLMSNPEKLAALRQSMRGKLLASPVCDAQHFARHLEEALIGAWTD